MTRSKRKRRSLRMHKKLLLKMSKTGLRELQRRSKRNRIKLNLRKNII